MKKHSSGVKLGLAMILTACLATGCGASPAAEGRDIPEPIQAAEETSVALSASLGEVQACRPGDTFAARPFQVTVEDLNVLRCTGWLGKPLPGYEFSEVVLTLENTSDRELIINSMMDFEAYVDGYAVSEYLFARPHSDHESMDGTLAPGETLVGSLCYELPSDWSRLEINVSLGLRQSDRVRLILEHETA